ncbi:uncharacterized protein LOC141661156 [Apium graveolens]|uniref:uncharacterized protein LOC141661156 n=1 Tax=Apium graveolens TaxID=4045 RepID=UPI003D7A17A0
MRLYLMSQDEGFVRCIDNGPHVPKETITGLVEADGTIGTDKIVVKHPDDCTPEDLEEVNKYKRAMNIMFNGIYSDMFECVMNSPTAKDVWDTIRNLYEGSKQVRENKMQLLIRQYEYFQSIPGKSLSETFSRFQKLLNGLRLHKRVYLVKDSNMKFLRSLPKEWKSTTVSIRNSYDYKDHTLDRLYGVLKTYELEM